MTAATAVRSAYPPAIADLMPKAIELTKARDGELPSRNRLMKDLHIGSDKAKAVLDELVKLAERDQNIKDLHTVMVRRGTTAPRIPLHLVPAKPAEPEPPVEPEVLPPDPANSTPPAGIFPATPLPSTVGPAVPGMTADAIAPSQTRGTGPFYLVALVCSGLSLDTAFRFFGEHMGITGLIAGFPAERAALCGVGELTLIACGYAMRHNVRRDGKAGAAQLVALMLCTAASFMAVALDGPVTGLLRAFFGPILALITLHLALGIEVHVRHGKSTGALARIGRELRERLLSRIGLADDDRPALTRSRDRAADRAARLAAGQTVLLRRFRLARAVRQSGAALDPRARARLLAQLNAQRTIGDLTSMSATSPWK
ncbi:hypothetical protein [Actinoplanes sp. NPDC026619]|uniref:hypothetical protein n=1 Tax=Actinoplanes sp. NPDC026619 TaxID=3155798 RepID=UPI003405BB29